MLALNMLSSLNKDIIIIIIIIIYVSWCHILQQFGERGGLVVNASDSGSRGRGFEPHSGQTVLCP